MDKQDNKQEKTNENKKGSEYKTITATPKFYHNLKKQYEKAVEKGEEQFTFEGNEYLTAYAKYLLQYCEMQGLGKK